MAMAAAGDPGSLIEDVVNAIGSAGDNRPNLIGFTERLYERADPADLAGYGVASLADIAIRAHDFFLERQPGTHKLRAFDPEQHPSAPNWPGNLTVLEIVNDDMPFLVDSIMGDIKERGIQVYLVLHPIFHVRRDEAGRLTSFAEFGEEKADGVKADSLIHIHMERVGPDLEAELLNALERSLNDVRTVVADWRPMLARMQKAIAAYTNAPPPTAVADVAESLEFLRWLGDDNFTFLGMREFTFEGDAQSGTLRPIPQSGLGILRDPDVVVLRRGAEKVHMTPEVRRFFLAPTPLIITKANMRSTVHRRVHMDYIGIKTYDANGAITGELRVVGLFTSAAYTRSVKRIPFLRHKVDMVLRRYGRPLNSHGGKALLNILETFPRDELFQIDVNLLFVFATQIHNLDLRPRTRVFPRLDEFDRFVSVLVYVPRERFTTAVRRRIGRYLASTYNGRVSAYYPFFPEGPLVRIHFIIGRSEGETPVRDPAELEADVARIVRTWEDDLEDAIQTAFPAGDAQQFTRRYLRAFSAGYSETFGARRAIEDIKRIEQLGDDKPIDIDFYRDDDPRPERARAAIYHLGGPLPLSERVPILENQGFNVIDERSYRIEPADGVGEEVSLHDMVLRTRDRAEVDLGAREVPLEDSFGAVWRGNAANDAYNQLTLKAGLDWRGIAVIRAYGAYLRQIQVPYSQGYMAATLGRHTNVTAGIVRLYDVRFSPSTRAKLEDPEAAERAVLSEIEEALDAVPSLDEDRILRYFTNLVTSTLRTNSYKFDDKGQPPSTIIFKFASAKIDGAPHPRPYREIFVYSTRFQGIHLRFGAIARGGLRWSDRPEDFRTEVLGLVKAQQVKNGVIVPQGAKGGFVPKHIAESAGREERLAEGVACYKIFIESLLRLTDNIVGNDIVPPRDVVRHDGDDPYLVVAADKGTATFSDIANEIAEGRGFWLGDAFASGGSAGYDHKKMGITARGAWEAVKRIFREMDVDIQTTPFTVVGVGDMSGDVFGNGMLLSEKIRLVAAFDHRDIFIDPDPDTAASFAERRRLFDLPRSSWQDYNQSLISAGGGVFSRSAKSIPLSPQIQAALGVDKPAMTPNELIRAILMADADLMWFGGIGTYIRASSESDEDAGDRANDVLRITPKEMRVKAVGEGANLGMTQRARIEFALAGGRVNTDFIDNSAGVNSSDMEVNIKIALNKAVGEGQLTRADRDALLAEMTEEVAETVLRNNYLQTLAISVGEMRKLSDLGFQMRLMRDLERKGSLDREIEFLPADSELAERREAGQPLTRPELAVLLAYAKIDLFVELLEGPVPDDPYLVEELMHYFPATLQERHPDDIAAHRLRREIIATQMSNTIINRGGSTMIVRMREETGHGVTDICYAYMAARAVFNTPDLYLSVDALDNKIGGQAQLELYARIQDLIRQATGWFLRNMSFADGLSDVVNTYRDGIAAIRSALPDLITEAQRTVLEADRDALIANGVPASVAESIAGLRFLADGTDIVLAAGQTGRPVIEVAKALFDVECNFKVRDLKIAGERLAQADYFDRLAVSRTLWGLGSALRGAIRAMAEASGPGPLVGFEAWSEARGPEVAEARRSVTEIVESGELTLARLTVAASEVRDLVAD